MTRSLHVLFSYKRRDVLFSAYSRRYSQINGNHCPCFTEGGTLSPTDQERMIEEIARRLSKIADDCVQRMGGESHSSRGISVDPLLSPNSKSM